MSAKPGLLERRLDAWARWAVSGGLGSTGKSILARWMDSKGHLVFGGAPDDSADLIESIIEAAVLKMATNDLLRADVLRLEFGAGCYGVAERRGIRSYDPRNMNQAKHALVMGLSYRTYRRRLAEAKLIVQDALTTALSVEKGK
jgi:hypothetical protein